MSNIQKNKTISGNKKKHFPSHLVQNYINGTPEEFWSYFEPIDLSKIFKRTKWLPAIKRTTFVDSWDTPGQKRTVYFETGDTAQEEIIECSKPNYFRYKVSKFTFLSKYFCKYAIGEWNIYSINNKTVINWIYTFYPKYNPIFKLILKLFVKIIWIEYMELSMINLINGYITHSKNLKNIGD